MDPVQKNKKTLWKGKVGPSQKRYIKWKNFFALWKGKVGPPQNHFLNCLILGVHLSPFIVGKCKGHLHIIIITSRWHPFPEIGASRWITKLGSQTEAPLRGTSNQFPWEVNGDEFGFWWVLWDWGFEIFSSASFLYCMSFLDLLRTLSEKMSHPWRSTSVTKSNIYKCSDPKEPEILKALRKMERKRKSNKSWSNCGTFRNKLLDLGLSLLEIMIKKVYLSTSSAVSGHQTAVWSGVPVFPFWLSGCSHLALAWVQQCLQFVPGKSGKKDKKVGSGNESFSYLVLFEFVHFLDVFLPTTCFSGPLSSWPGRCHPYESIAAGERHPVKA